MLFSVFRNGAIEQANKETCLGDWRMAGSGPATDQNMEVD